MKDVNFGAAAIPAPPVAPNGAHENGNKKAAARKRSSRTGPRNTPAAAPHAIDAAFAAMEVKPADAQMWQHNPVLWFQPERAPSPPAWTGLAIERHKRIPPPEFSLLETAPLNRPDRSQSSREAFQRAPRLRLPQSDLAPLGWDPRALARKEEAK